MLTRTPLAALLVAQASAVAYSGYTVPLYDDSLDTIGTTFNYFQFNQASDKKTITVENKATFTLSGVSKWAVGNLIDMESNI
jgi:hypothetical protein|mmetsp:Transcript_15853/g.21466  ORF Transcript_15853/g.21466 Transcript_15853/m.21466 type:complete len:82 (-) Transcript_15853:664-909(-)